LLQQGFALLFSLNSVWHYFQHHSRSLTSSALDHSTTSTPLLIYISMIQIFTLENLVKICYEKFKLNFQTYIYTVAVCRALGYYILGFGAGREILYNNSVVQAISQSRTLVVCCRHLTAFLTKILRLEIKLSIYS
jgi:ABC-type multidrug transport system permease subunit